MCSLAAMRIQTSEGANNKCTFTNWLRSCALTSQRCCLHPYILLKLMRNAPACAYGFNGYAHCFSRTFKKTNEWEMLNQIMHRQREAGRRASIFSLSLSLSHRQSTFWKPTERNAGKDTGPRNSLANSSTAMRPAKYGRSSFRTYLSTGFVFTPFSSNVSDEWVEFLFSIQKALSSNLYLEAG